jgi:hypothetical protein
MSNFVETVFGSSWRTTLAGYGTAAAVAAFDYIQANGDLSKIDTKSLVAAVGIAVLGRVAKATNVSNSPTPLAVGQPIVLSTPKVLAAPPVVAELAKPVEVESKLPRA